MNRVQQDPAVLTANGGREVGGARALIFGTVVVLAIAGYATSRFSTLLATLSIGTTLMFAASWLWESRRTGEWAGLTSTLVAAVSLISVVLPGYQLLSGDRPSRLTLLGVYGVDATREMPQVYALAVGAVAALALGEVLAVGRAAESLPPDRDSRPSLWGGHRFDNPATFLAALVVGAVVTSLTAGHSQEVFAERGQVSGQGLTVALMATLPVGIALGIVNRHWGSRGLAMLSVLGVLVLVGASQSRSPVLLLVIALAIRALSNKKLVERPTRLIALALVLTYVVAVFIVAFSSYRTAVLRHESLTYPEAVAAAASNPVEQLATVGALDTADGMMLSLRVDRDALDIQFYDPIKGVTHLIPSQLWSNKPEFLGPKVSHEYTRFGGQAGIFLSGPGYTYLVWGGFVGGLIAFFLLGQVAGYVATRVRQTGIVFVLFVYFYVRFYVAGDAFDLLFVLTMLVGLTIVHVLSSPLRAVVQLREKR